MPSGKRISMGDSEIALYSSIITAIARCVSSTCHVRCRRRANMNQTIIKPEIQEQTKSKLTANHEQ